MKRQWLIEGDLNLAPHDYEKRSHALHVYNCIAFVADDFLNWWDGYGIDPGMFWPEGAEKGGETIHLIGAFKAIGFEDCTDADPERGHEKIALYEKKGVWTNAPLWTHAARLRDDGWWESKVGRGADIIHRTAQAIEGKRFGKISVYMKRSLHNRVLARLLRNEANREKKKANQQPG